MKPTDPPATLLQQSSELTFQLLDDALLGLEIGLDTCVQALKSASTRRLGPIVELLFARESNSRMLPPVSALRASTAVSALEQGLSSVASGVANPSEARPAEFLRVGSQGSHFYWDSFCIRAQHAAERSGLKKATAQGIVAAIRELEDNILVHSDRPSTGVVAYRWEPGEFEFVIADGGIGVLNSLRRCSDYCDLFDSGRALEVALREGESRFGRGVGRGYGFKPLFVGMANLCGHLRFRSDDHCLEINGQEPNRMFSRILQRPTIGGFQISVICQHAIPK